MSQTPPPRTTRRGESVEIPGPRMSGWLVLIGGGEFSFGETEEVDRFLLDRMPADRRKVAFLPTASGSPDYAKHFAEYLTRLDPSVEVRNVPVYRSRDARRRKNLDLIRESGMVYFGGGVTNRLLDAVRGEPAAEALLDVLAAGGVVAGIGASAECLGEITRSMLTLGAPLDGLSYIPGGLVISHHSGDWNPNFEMLMRHQRVTIGIAIPERCALAISPDREGEILGEGTVAVVRKQLGAASTFGTTT
ncbi:MAG: Type 1 glutamine amidotransferase-like domain-containing protein [Thermoanaerobaculia bacterium]|nr:Type 1 glutamine amidotransferase-like domain-containing protein [Thermoanaerobaculia bacterium]